MENELGPPQIADNELRFNCPFCDSDTKHKLYLHVGNDERKGLWNCFKCGSKGNPVSFTMKYFHVSFSEAVGILGTYSYRPDMENYVPKDDSLTDEEYLLLLLDNKNQEEKEVEKQEMNYKAPPLPEGYKRLQDNLNNPEIIPFLKYISKRGFTSQDILDHEIGYVKDSLVPLPSGKSVRLINHLVFLTHDFNGSYQYWNTRAIGDSFVKSVNAPSAEDEYSKKNVIFNLNQAIKENEVVLTEGVPDALTIGKQGLATFGKQVTTSQIDLLLSNMRQEQKIFIMLDTDAKKVMANLGNKLYSNHEETYFVVNPNNEDANDMGHDKSWEVIRNNSVKADEIGQIRIML